MLTEIFLIPGGWQQQAGDNLRWDGERVLSTLDTDRGAARMGCCLKVTVQPLQTLKAFCCRMELSQTCKMKP